ncbi:MAG: hypothetical protein LH654_08715 [Thermoleophilia bacterium]|nr:hypothetical protein [Thermoleophilia bacterium]
MTIPPLLEELLLAHGVSGSEDAVQAIVRREAEALGAEITTDVLGSTIARVRGLDRVDSSHCSRTRIRSGW